MRIVYNAVNVYRCGPMRLFPGINDVAEADFATVAEHPGVLARIEAGTIKVQGEIKLKPADVAEIFDVSRLQSLASGPDKAIAKAAAARLVELTTSDPEPEADTGDPVPDPEPEADVKGSGKKGGNKGSGKNG